MKSEKRPSIGVMIGGMHTSFPVELIRGISQKAREEQAALFVFPRIHTKPFFKKILGNISSNVYDYQFNTIYDYCKLSGADGIIINYGTIGFHMQQDNSRQFAARYNSRPLVFVTEKVSVENCHSIISDNMQGMMDIISHLVTHHGCRKILLMRGPDGNTDAAERFQGYLEAMAHFDLPVEPDMVAGGDFSTYVEPQVEWLLDHNPDADAIVFSNDEMASAAYRVCERRGIRIGTDLKITGYDGSPLVETLTPPLTSVFQDAYGMGQRAVSDLLRILDGQVVPDEYYPVHVVERESCGCVHTSSDSRTEPMNYEEELNRYRQQLAHQEAQYAEYQGKSWFIPMMARDLSDSFSDETEFCRQVMEKLRLLQPNAAYLFLLDHPVVYDGISEWNCPEKLHLASCYRQGTVTAYQPCEAPQVTEENGFARLTEDGEAHQFLVFLLFSGNRQYGLLACDVPISEISFYYVVSLQLGLSLRYFEMNMIEVMRRKQITQDMQAIRAQNEVLHQISGYDQLTGLLNLRGLQEKVRQLCADAALHQGYVIYCDMDHLKEINDTWGHQEGNFAICTCANILQRAVRESDILARMGGDEFLCLVLSDSEAFPEVFANRLRAISETENAQSGKPYYIEASYGIQPIALCSPEDFQTAMELADKQLYRQKVLRRSSVKKAEQP